MIHILARHDRTQRPGRKPGASYYSRRIISLFHYDPTASSVQGQATIIHVNHTLAHASLLLSAWHVSQPRSRQTLPRYLLGARLNLTVSCGGVLPRSSTPFAAYRYAGAKTRPLLSST
jgi:hypothetical protein